MQNLVVTTNDVRGPAGSPYSIGCFQGSIGLSIEVAADMTAATSNVHSARDISMVSGGVMRNTSRVDVQARV
jgi:hypothetical protein